MNIINKSGNSYIVRSGPHIYIHTCTHVHNSNTSYMQSTHPLKRHYSTIHTHPCIKLLVHSPLRARASRSTANKQGRADRMNGIPDSTTALIRGSNGDRAGHGDLIV